MSTMKLVSVIGVVALVSCGSNGGGKPADTTAFISQYCDVYMPCCTKAGRSSDPAQCKAVYAAFGATSATYDATAGGKCIDALKAASSSATFCDDMGGNDLTECSSVLSSSGGAKNPGEACTQDQDCASSTEGKVACATSYSSGGAQTKVCQVQIKGKAGDAPCVATIDGDISYLTSSSTTPPSKGYTCDLADHLYCDTSGVSSNPPDAGQPPPKCTAQQDVGGPCTSSYGHECVKTAYCDYAQHKCMARVATGGDCSASSSSCAPGNNCDGTSKKCVAQLANGATCTAAAQCLSGQCVNGACAASQSLTLQMLCAAK